MFFFEQTLHPLSPLCTLWRLNYNLVGKRPLFNYHVKSINDTKATSLSEKALETNSLEVRFLSIRTLDYLYTKDYFI